MERIIYDRTLSAHGSVLSCDNYVVVKKKASLKHRVFLSPIVKYVIPTLIAMAFLMSIVYLSMYFVLSNTEDIWISTCNIRASYRIDCFPGKSRVSYEACNAVDCCWHEENKFCFHSIPSRHGYMQNSDADTFQEKDVFVPRRATSPFGKKNTESLTFHIKEQTDPNHIEFALKIGQANTRTERNNDQRRGTLGHNFLNDAISQGTDAHENDLSEKLLNFLPKNAARKTSKIQTDPKSSMDVYIHTPEFSVTVTRKNDASRPLLTTARGPLILTEHFWELTLYITNSTLYGLNKQELNGTTNWIYDNENGTSRLAFLGVHANGEATSCYVGYDGPIEIEVIDESNLIILKGLSLPNEISFHIFSGHTPLQAIAQLTKSLRNLDPIELPSLGLHICPNDDSKSFDDSIAHVIQAMKGTPWDSHCIHQGFYPTLGNSINVSIVEKAIALLTNDDDEIVERTVVPHLSPMVFADNNILALTLADESLLLKTVSGPYVGTYRKLEVCYPDWHDTRTHNESLPFLTTYMENFRHPKLVYIRDSWPRDESKGHEVLSSSIFDYVPPVLQYLMADGTVPYTLTSSSRGKSHYTEHGSYSSDFINFIRQRRESTSLLIRGLWGESGNSSWSALEAAIRDGVSAGIVGQLPPPMYACGTGEQLGSGVNNDQLCSRWYGASVAWPYVLAIPTNLPGGKHLTVTSASYVTKHLELRSSLVTYARTVLAQHYIEGLPVLAPTFVHYPKDLQARRKWNQFMWGSDILVGVVTLPGVSQVPMWIPGMYAWRYLETGIKVQPTAMESIPITATEGQIVTLMRPGSIIPIHKIISKTSASTLKSDLTLVVNLDPDDDSAYGKVFYGSHANDDTFLIINATRAAFKLTNVFEVQKKVCKFNGTRISNQGTQIDKIVLYGYGEFPLNKNLCTMDADPSEIPLPRI